MIVIDASVWVAADSADEEARTTCAALFARVVARGMTIHQPSLTLVEVTAAVARRTRDDALAQEAGSVLMEAPGLVLHDLDIPAAAEASIVAARSFLRGADAVYVACAIATSSVLVTLDPELLERARTSVKVMTPAAWLASVEPTP